MIVYLYVPTDIIIKKYILFVMILKMPFYSNQCYLIYKYFVMSEMITREESVIQFVIDFFVITTNLLNKIY